ncbi:MAG: Ig-like domain-containing protein, partial [Planctomycetota bacterium]|nr:Ig-like domain-containing protein [Planctomycetota bacterium]
AFPTDAYYIGLASTTASATAGAFLFTNAQPTTYVPVPPGDSPAGAADAYTAEADHTLTVPYTAGVLVNDTDSDGNSLSAAVATGPAHGTLSLQGNGAFTYTPAPGYVGLDSFTYTLDDGHGLSQTGTANLTVAIAGDVNLDGQVGLLDYNVIKANFGLIGGDWQAGDLNGDGQVGLLDFNIVKAHFGNIAPPVPLTPAIQPMIGPVWSGSAALASSPTSVWTATGSAATEREKIDASALVLTPELSVVGWSAVATVTAM